MINQIAIAAVLCGATLSVSEERICSIDLFPTIAAASVTAIELECESI